MAEAFSARFVLEHHDDFGTDGARPAWMPDGDPMDGRAVAHDTLEHGGAGDESIPAELRAVGAAYWLRWESGAVSYDAPSGYTPTAADSIASDFLDMFRHFEAEGYGVADPAGRDDAGPLGDEYNAAAAEAVFGEAVASIRETIRGEFGDDIGDYIDAEAFERFTSDDYARRFVGWLRVGYRDALRRFDGCDAWTVYRELFERIADSVDVFLIRSADEIAFDGSAVLVVDVDPDASAFVLRVELPEIECHECEGYCEAEGDCPDCDASGWADECPACDGGRSDDADTCEPCDGEGLKPCEPCEGKGERVRPCPTCDGEGMGEHWAAGPVRVYDRDEARAIIDRARRGY